MEFSTKIKSQNDIWGPKINLRFREDTCIFCCAPCSGGAGVGNHRSHMIPVQSRFYQGSLKALTAANTWKLRALSFAPRSGRDWATAWHTTECANSDVKPCYSKFTECVTMGLLWEESREGKQAERGCWLRMEVCSSAGRDTSSSIWWTRPLDR
jgi:hypothetical protein